MMVEFPYTDQQLAILAPPYSTWWSEDISRAKEWFSPVCAIEDTIGEMHDWSYPNENYDRSDLEAVPRRGLFVVGRREYRLGGKWLYYTGEPPPYEPGEGVDEEDEYWGHDVHFAEKVGTINFGAGQDAVYECPHCGNTLRMS